MQYINEYESPIGKMTLGSDGNALTGLWFHGGKFFCEKITENPTVNNLPVFEQTKEWLDVYFSGKIPDFTPRLSLQGTDFRKAVWEILLTIPYGETLTYGEIARRVAKQRNLAKMSAQAVGGAVGHNPISIIVPCHRVIGADGSLTGYAGGLNKKRKLLKLEMK